MTSVQHPADVHPDLAELRPGWHFADPGPLGLAAFALTTFVLSFMNTGLFKAEPVVFGLALAYGGGVQILAGMWEFAKGNTFGATAFCSYGGFWISFWYLTGHTNLGGIGGGDLNKSLGIWVVAWAIFTAYMLIASLRTNLALVAVFGFLTLTFIFLAIGYFTANVGATTPDAMTKIGGWLGLVTAVVAWYTSFAGVLSSTFRRPVLPTGAR